MSSLRSSLLDLNYNNPNIALGTAAQARLDALAAPRLAAIQTAPDAYKIDGGNISEAEY